MSEYINEFDAENKDGADLCLVLAGYIRNILK